MKRKKKQTVYINDLVKPFGLDGVCYKTREEAEAWAAISNKFNSPYRVTSTRKFVEA